MRRPGHIIAIALLGTLVPLASSSVSAAPAAPSPKAKTVILHAAAGFHGKAGFMHVMASAKLTYSKHDVFIKLTTDNLPNPKTLGQRVYMLFAADGKMTVRVGALKTTGNMAGVSGQVMMTKVQDLYVYAVPSTGTKHPMGVEVLSAMV